MAFAPMAYILEPGRRKELALLFLFLFALAWPWEIFQRLPFVGITLVKAAGLSLIALAALDWAKARRLPQTGLALPLAVFAVACGQSVLHSVDRGLSLSLLWQFFTYFLLFNAVSSAASGVPASRRVALAFALSAVAVAVLAMACAAGWLAPSLASPIRPLGRHLSAEMRNGALVRVAPTTTDFNQGVLMPLVAFPMVLYLLGRERGLLRRWLSWPAAALLVGGIVVAFSRSSLLAIVLLTAGCLFDQVRTRRRLWPLAGAVLVGAVLALAFGEGYLLALGERLTRGIGRRDASYETRWYVFGLAGQILPRHFLFGCGLGASDQLIAQIADPAKWKGTTVHSMPYKLLLETGILGFVAYFWLWWRAFRDTWRLLYRSENEDLRRFGAAFLGVFFACFFVLAIQPFGTLSVFPLLLGLAYGPMLRMRADEMPQDGVHMGSPRVPIAAALAVAALVFVNQYQYQAVAKAASHFADALDEAYQAEAKGDWLAAEGAYRSAESCPPLGVAELEASAFADTALAVADTAFVFEAMGLDKPGRRPSTAVSYGRARLDFGAPAGQDALAAAEKLVDESPHWAQARYLLAESLWLAESYERAIDAYAAAVQCESAPGNTKHRERMAVMDARIDTLLDGGLDDAGLAEVCLWLRKRGRWEEAAALCQTRSQQGDPPPTIRRIIAINQPRQQERDGAL